jgi:hypothetical protein
LILGLQPPPGYRGGNGDFWGDVQSAPLHLNQQLTPAPRRAASLALRAVGVAVPPTVRQVAEA